MIISILTMNDMDVVNEFHCQWTLYIAILVFMNDLNETFAKGVMDVRVWIPYNNFNKLRTQKLYILP